MATATPTRIPVRNSDNVIIERVDSARARRMAKAPNATAIRARKGGAIVGINLASDGDDSAENSLHGNPRSYSHDHETASNPEKVWTLKRIPTSTQSLYCLSVTDCLVDAPEEQHQTAFST